MTAHPERAIRKFNPGTFQPDQEIIEQFVVRTHELGIVLGVLRGNVEAASCQHVLLVAPRGRGKSMLLARVASELRGDEALSKRLLPVRFMEESQEIFGIADFWLETLFHLAREVAARDEGLSRELQATHASLADRWREEGIAQRARAAVLEAADRLGQQLVLMVENFQSLSDDTDEHFGWELRKVLQAEQQIMLLATATCRFEALDDAGQAFFELFRTVPLPALDTQECRRLWEVVSGERVSARDIRPLQILTGGSPRLLVIVADFARHRSLRQLMEELVTLIDEHTEYFRSHLESFAKSERRVYLAVIDLWQPSSAAEVAARARMDVRGVSAQLGRLVKRGAVSVEGTGRKLRYAAAERLYSIYYKLRRERDEAAVVRNLIHFMAAFYSGHELETLSERLAAEAMLSPGIREGIERAVAERPELASMLSFTRSRAALEANGQDAVSGADGVNLALTEIDAAFLDHNFERVIHPVTEWCATSADAPSSEEVAWAMGVKAHAHFAQGTADAAIATYDEVVARSASSEDCRVQRLVAKALVNKAIAQVHQGNAPAAIATYDEVVTRFASSEAPEIQSEVARALVNKGVIQGQQGGAQAEIATYDELLACFANSGVPEVQGAITWALVNKGCAQGQLGDEEAEIATYDELLARFASSGVPEVQGSIARALVNKGVIQGQQGDTDAAIANFDEVVGRFSCSKSPEVQLEVASALVNKGVAQTRRGDAEAAIATFNEVVARFASSEVPEVQGKIARALVNKGVTQGQQGDTDAATATFDEVRVRFAGTAVPEVQGEIARALLNKGIAQARFGSIDAALETWRTLEREYGALVDRESISYSWHASWERLDALMAMGTPQEAISTFRSVYATFEPSRDAMMGIVLERVPALVRAGFSVDDLLDVLRADNEKASALAPLIVALRQRADEDVRAPAEMLEVASDIRSMMEGVGA